MQENKYYSYMGGTIEEVPKGEFLGIDQGTGKETLFTWNNHVKVVGREAGQGGKPFKSKLSKAAIEAVILLYNDNSDFRSWVEQC